MIKKIYIILIFSLIFIQSYAQTKVRGKIFDKDTKEPIPFANVAFKGTTIGTITDHTGIFFMETRTDVDSIQVSCMGYKSITIAINKNAFQEFELYLKPQSYDIEEVVVRPGENPAHKILRKVIANRKKNDYRRFNSYSYESYNKIELDLNNFNKNLKYVKGLKPLGILFEGTDTSTVNGKIYLPFMISESLSDYYFRRRPIPKRQKEIIKAINISGVDNKSVKQFTGQMYTEINFYENFVDIFEKQFVSPIAYTGRLTYKYYLTDSAFIDNKWCYQLSFKPRLRGGLTFKGDMWVADTTFAIKSMSARISPGANIDFIVDMFIKQQFTAIDDSLYFPNQEYIFIDFNISNFTAGFFGKKTSTRKNIKINPKFHKNFFSKTIPREIIALDSSSNKSADFWEKARYKKLSSKEKQIYATVDSLFKIPKFLRMKKLVNFLTLGYFPVGYFEFGPYQDFISKNVIEGRRFSLGGRTTYDFSRKIELSGSIAYALGDKKFKYFGGAKYKFKNKNWTMAKAFYQYDMIQLGENRSQFSSNSFFSSALSRTPNDNLLIAHNWEVGLEKDWTKGVYNDLTFTGSLIYPSDSVKFITNSGEEKKRLNISEIRLNTHIAINEEYVAGVFSRAAFGSVFPTININYIFSVPNFKYSDYNYQKLIINLKHFIYLGPLGKFSYFVEAGKIWGKVPYPLLELHPGSETYMYEPNSFNLMNFYEFASDEYVSIFLENHFDGIIFNRIPILRRLHLREFIYGRGVIGNLKDENRNEFKLPETLNDVNKPYIEVGAGIDNILTFFSINAVWRLTHLENPNISKFGLRFGIVIGF